MLLLGDQLPLGLRHNAANAKPHRDLWFAGLTEPGAIYNVNWTQDGTSNASPT